MNVIGHCVIDGVPHINGKPARWDDKMADMLLLDGAFSRWRCPECGACLSGDGLICLNACHFSAPMAARFQQLMIEAHRRVARRSTLLAEGKIIDAIGDLDGDGI